MFSGIIKDLGLVTGRKQNGGNVSFSIKSKLLPQLQVDQSLAHNGVCLTVESIEKDYYTVTAVAETLAKTTLNHFREGAYMNLEPCLQLNSLLDGHLVQGHVDCTATCISVEENNGSTNFSFSYPQAFFPLLVEKGSVTVNGVSLTAFNCVEDKFTVTIIPYTLQNTTFSTLKAGEDVNIEFDVIGKYFQRHMQHYARQFPYNAPAENASESIH